MEASGRRYQRRPTRPIGHKGRTPAVKGLISAEAVNRLLIRVGICALIFIALAIYRNTGMDMTKISGVIDADDALGYTEIMGYIGRAISPDGEQPVESENKPAETAPPAEEANLDEPNMPANALLDPGEMGEGENNGGEDLIMYDTAGLIETGDSAAYQNLSFITDDLGTDTTDPGPFRMLSPDNVVESKVALGFKYTTPLVGNVTSPFAYRVHPIDGETKFHYGLDIAGAQGKAIAAFAEGRIIESGFNVAYGNYIKIEHSGGYVTLYGHCSKVYVSKGDKVKMGQKIGAVGMTGWATGPHLHFEIRNNGKYYDPTYYVAL